MPHWAIIAPYVVMAIQITTEVLRRKAGKMGFRKDRKQYRLRFETEEYAGFICQMASLTVDEFIETTTLATRLQANDADPESIGRLFDILAEKIIDWNLEDDNGQPIGHSPADLRGQDFDFIMDIQMAWMTAMAGVPAPLPDSSNNGGTTQEAITASLANLSRSLPS